MHARGGDRRRGVGSPCGGVIDGPGRDLAGHRFEVASAGTEARGVHPLAKRVMAEVGIDLRGHTSKTLDRFLGEPWDFVITVCDSANEACPVFPATTRRLHWSLDDPSAARGNEEERLGVFRRVRDEIRSRVEGWLDERRVVRDARSA